jgi:hypothetical protein
MPVGFFSFGSHGGIRERTALPGIPPEREFVMPVWMEVLLNLIGYAGFVGVATFNRSAEEPPQARGERVS